MIALLALPLILCLATAAPAQAKTTAVDKAEADPAVRVTAAYAAFAEQIYRRSRSRAAQLSRVVEAFLKAPDAASLRKARAAWTAAREVYGQTEVLRFYGGPIDNRTDGPETLLNAWPLDEAYIDVVRGHPRGGILQDQKRYPNLNGLVLSLANERGGEANVCVGWHAVEFMLWGQDFDPAGPGRRSHREFLDAHDASAARRRAYLRVVSRLLVRHLEQVEEAWRPKRANYRATFEASPAEAVRRILTGMIVLSGFEMAGERLAVAYETRDQEQEHSCFSDTTHRDLLANQRGILAVYRGTGPGMDGIGFRELAWAKDARLAAAIDRQLDRALQALRGIPVPFDQAILGKDTSPGRKAVLAAMTALETQTDLLAALGLVLGYEIPVQPSVK